ncbi:LuxR C-terminal-related transcriptional regulator [Salinimicrobium sp. TH3]|uniref:LuxR C-terminal-related transcriptional regulator n=1 Tax=Salinimicrobium sp. TH3 TaxID=2997342 RepID=UPI002275C0FF|nr:LuxR C-terminal-related transcriptional regulator [Salinimicrobium sp. TH3]MCY2686720.1 LuxR C-terminal-related transcriptional regulator [Salinimicrobium sp. TH3]
MEKTFEQKLEIFSACAEFMPCVIVIHELRKKDFKVVFMSSRGLDQLGLSLQELSGMGPEYHERFFNNEDMEDFMVKLRKLLEKKDPDETFTFFQQVRFKDRKDWVWHIASVRIFHQAPDGTPTHIVTAAIPINRMKHIENKAERLLKENMFFKENLSKYLCLGKRAKEVLRLVALGKSSAEIAEELSISIDTVHTHRKNIKKKLEISSSFEFTEYARAYDLI